MFRKKGLVDVQTSPIKRNMVDIQQDMRDENTAGSKANPLNVCGLPVADAHFTSLDGLLWHSLPEVEVAGSSSPDYDHDEDPYTHPTAVKHWSTFIQEVKQRMSQPDIVAMRGRQYEKRGFSCYNFQLSADGAVSSLVNTACDRLNHLFNITKINKVAEQRRNPTVEMQSEEGGDAPDIVMVERHRGTRHVLFTIEVRFKFQLRNVQHYTLPSVWALWRGGLIHLELSADAVYNACHAISQELGYMSRRGHLYGMISTYHHSWFLKSDGKGSLWISDAALLFAALCNSERMTDPYPTARSPGEEPLSTEQFAKLRRDTPSSSSQAAASHHTDTRVTSSRTAPDYSSCALRCDVVLTTKLSNTVFLGRFGGSIAAIRMALSMDDITDAQTEVEAYQCLQQLQGQHVPQLLGYGRSGQGFCVATSYIQGEQFNWHSHSHRALDSQLLAVIHSFGICHHDLHQGNILVTADHKIVLLDFAGASLQSTAEERMAERKHMAML